MRCEHATSLVKGERVRAVIGDRVEIDLPDGHDCGIVCDIEPRRTQLVRKDPTERTLPQVLAANFDLVILAEPLAELNRKRLEHNWGFSLAIGMVEFIIALCLLCTIKLFDNEGWNIALRIPLLSVYTAIASILSIFIGFTCFKDKTDRFMWIVMGMVGCVLGFIMLGASGLSETAHIQLFGTYLLVKGLTDLIFGIHSRNEIEESTTKTRSKKAKGKK